MEQAFTRLKARLAGVHDLRKALDLAWWDLETMMPPAGGDARAELLATLDRLAHETFTADDTGQLLDELAPYERSLPYESDEASLIRVARRDYERARRVPADLRAELARAASQGLQIWLRAREAEDFEVFRPALERNLELQSRYIACFEHDGDPYDVLLGEYEEGLTTAEVEAVFERLKAETIPLVAGLRPDEEADGLPALSIAEQEELLLRVLQQLGWDRRWARIDRAVHPFAASFALDDIRLTTRYFDGDLRSLYAGLHEFGHGLFEHGVDRALERTLLARGVSSALHESQSRLWENLVGRSLPFCRWLAPQLPTDAHTLYRAVNRVEPSLIRVDADEITYNLHIILRFELERELIAGRLSPRDVRDAWNARTREYLGIEVPSDSQGVLQDMHWSDALMGYFPTYSLGNVVSVQIWERARQALPELDADIERGDFEPLAGWLREHLYRHGRKFTPKETLERAAGAPLDPEPYLRYLTEKLYSLA